MKCRQPFSSMMFEIVTWQQPTATDALNSCSYGSLQNYWQNSPTHDTILCTQRLGRQKSVSRSVIIRTDIRCSHAHTHISMQYAQESQKKLNTNVAKNSIQSCLWKKSKKAIIMKKLEKNVLDRLPLTQLLVCLICHFRQNSPMHRHSITIGSITRMLCFDFFLTK